MMPGLLLAAALAAPTAPPPASVFACKAGRKRIAIVQRGDTLTYSFGPAGRPEISLNGTPAGGVYYHRTMYNRGEDQTLRFTRGAWSYLLFNRWQAPQQLTRGRIEPEYNVSGLLVMKDGAIVRRIDCDKGSGDLHEWPIFKRLRQDENNLTPDDA